MNSELEKLRKEMTREEFIAKWALSESYCPKHLDLEVKCRYKSDSLTECTACFKEAVKDIQFKDDIAIQDSGNRTQFPTGAVRDIHTGKGRMDLLPACALIRLSKHFESGATKYDERNWEIGIPVHSFIDSALRHLMNYLDGKTDEDHLCAAAWNCMCAMWTEEKHPELQDIPSRMGAKDGI
jgi:hypothetical protein